jgi:hypothetical protein
MAKKTTTSKKSQTTTSRARPAKSTKKRARKPRARSAASPARKSAKRAAKSGKKAPLNLRKTVDGYVSTLNDWRRECVASLGKIIRTAAPRASRKVKWLTDPRQLLQGTGRRIRHINLRRLKEAGKHELQELVRLATRLSEVKRSPTRRAKTATRK